MSTDVNLNQVYLKVIGLKLTSTNMVMWQWLASLQILVFSTKDKAWHIFLLGTDLSLNLKV